MLSKSCFSRLLPAAALAVSVLSALPLPAAALVPAAPLGNCLADAQTLCLNQGRFEVRAIWRDYDGVSGAGYAHPITANSGYFDFFSPNNVEVLVKVLDGCTDALGQHFWFFAGGLTDVQVELRVKDTLTGDFRLYTNRLGTRFDSILDLEGFATCDAGQSIAAAPSRLPALPLPLVPAPMGLDFDCQPFSGGNCLAERFAAKVSYRLPNGESGQGFGLRLTADTAAFHFYDPSNYEVVVKVLDACAEESPGYWVFAAGLTDLSAELEITDRVTGQTKVYQRGPDPFAPILDLGSFPCD